MDRWSHRGTHTDRVENTKVVATFNIHFAEGIDGRLDLERTANIINRTGAEILALQELDRGHPRSGRVDQPQTLSTLTGLHVTFFPTIKKEGWEYGIGLATRSPGEPTFVTLPRHRDEEPRAAIVSEMDGLTVIATHLATKPPARNLHMRALADLVRDARPPVVVLGDLNARARGTRPLREAGMAGGPRVGTTMTRSKKRIDWILAMPPARVLEARTIRSQASDHLPLVATLEVPS